MNKRLLPNLIIIFGLFAVCCNAWSRESTKKFVLVLDAGHGGHDAGAVGSYSKEKNINLNVTLELGRLVEANCNDVKVVYTRKTDVFIPLDERANIANRVKADLFISVHTNALPGGRIARGSETYTLGMARASANLEVAKRENAVILVEDNYKERYAGFNPNSAESYIIFEFMQDQYMKQSVSLATMIQQQYTSTAGRKNMGVQQAGFLVLRKTSMPSVLTELGFISTPDEEAYLNSTNGIKRLAFSIFRAFQNYKRTQDGVPPILVKYDGDKMEAAAEQPVSDKVKEMEKELTVVPVETTDDPVAKEATQEPEPKTDKEDSKPKVSSVEKNTKEDRPIFKIQILISSKKLNDKSPLFKGVASVDSYKEGGMYKYTYGETTDYSEILRLKKTIVAKFPDAFVVAFKDGEKTELNAAIRQSKKK